MKEILGNTILGIVITLLLANAIWFFLSFLGGDIACKEPIYRRIEYVVPARHVVCWLIQPVGE